MLNIHISSVYFLSLKNYIHHQQLSILFTVDELLGLDHMATQDFLTKFELKIFNTYIEKLFKAQLSDHLIFDIAKYFDIKQYGIIGYISTHANTFFDAATYLEKFCKFVIDANNVEHLTFITTAEYGTIRYPKWHEDCIWLNEINIASIFQILKQLSQSYADFNFYQIQLSHAPLIPVEIYQDFYQCDVIFNSQYNSLSLKNQYLEKNLPTRDTVLLGILLNQAEATYATLHPHNSTSNLEQKLTLLIQQYLDIGEVIPEIDVIANSFHMSKRTFQRKLLQHNIVYRQFLENIKMQYCMQLLKNSENSLSDIAQQLGYADQSSLGRAFKKNFGESMMQVRK